MPPPVYILLHRDTSDATTVLSVWADLADANAQCLAYAKEAGVALDKGDRANDKRRSWPAEPLRWDSPDGASCWVERHAVEPRKILQPPLRVAADDGPQRKGSRLYDEDEDDVIEVHDSEGHYD